MVQFTVDINYLMRYWVRINFSSDIGRKILPPRLR